MNVWRLKTHHIDTEMSLDWMHRNKKMAIGWGQVGNIQKQGYSSANAVADAIRAIWEYKRYRNAHLCGPSLWNFYREARHGDLVILTTKSPQLVVEIVGDYEWNEDKMPMDGDYNHQRKIHITTRNAQDLWKRAGGAAVGQNIYLSFLRCANAVN